MVPEHGDEQEVRVMRRAKENRKQMWVSAAGALCNRCFVFCVGVWSHWPEEYSLRHVMTSKIGEWRTRLVNTAQDVRLASMQNRL